MGFLDRAKKLAEQVKDAATDVMDKAKADDDASTAAAEARTSPGAGAPADTSNLRRAWTALDLPDPAAVLRPQDREPHGLPRSTRSEIVHEHHGAGRRWNVGDRSLGLLWLVEAGTSPASIAATVSRWQALRSPAATDAPGVGDQAYLDDAGGRRGVYVLAKGAGFVVEAAGIDDTALIELARQAVSTFAGLR